MKICIHIQGINDIQFSYIQKFTPKMLRPSKPGHHQTYIASAQFEL